MLLALLFLVCAPQGKDVAVDCDALLTRYERAGWSGTALVSREGKALVARGFGPADLATQRANEPATLFEIGSLSKQFTAAAILKLQQQGKLSLDDPISKHLPGVPAHSQAITIQQLLTHTSGIPRGNAGGSGEDLEAAVKAYLGSGPKEKPGARFEYWNGGYALLAGIVERASGTRFTEYCERELFAPSGLLDTGFTGDRDLPAERAAIGRSGSGEPRSALEHPYRSFGYQYRGMGGVVTTALDLLKWDRALAGTSVLDAAAKKLLFTPFREDYACGWYVSRSEAGGERHSHGGSVRGFSCEMRRFPATNACIVVLLNTDTTNAWELADNLESTLFGRALRHPVPESVEALREFAGIYAAQDARIVVRLEGDALVAGCEGQALLASCFPLQPEGWKADLAALSATAVQLVEAIARGDVELLRARMAKRIPADWPDDVRRQIYPQYAEPHGPLKKVSALGAYCSGERVEIVLALEHETSAGRVKVAFSSAGLELLDFKGPEFPVALRLLQQSGAKFTAQPDAGKSFRFEFVRKSGRIRGLKTPGLELQRKE